MYIYLDLQTLSGINELAGQIVTPKVGVSI